MRGRRFALALALAAIVAMPFLLRPSADRKGAGDVVVVVTPNNEEIRHEFEIGFRDWYRARTGRAISVDWRVPGGTAEIARLLEGDYVAAFRNAWTAGGRPWSFAIQAGFQDGRLPASAPGEVRAARAAFLASDVSSGIDVFFGGGDYDFEEQAEIGTLVDAGIEGAHPGWFGPGGIPGSFEGSRFRDPAGRWTGCVMSCYGMIYNRDALRRLGIGKPPARWSDLADPRYQGEIGLCDPTKSGSIAMAFEDVVQQEMHRRVASAVPGGEAEAVGRGWIDGLRILQLIGANARYFTDSSQKPPIDVADGDCAVGMCIDFYGREQEEALRLRGAGDRVGFSVPDGGTTYAVDPIGLLRGAPHASAGRAFIEYVLSLDGQKLWAFRPGSPGGPRDFALRRLPVRRDFYGRSDWLAYRSDPGDDPYAQGERLVYRPEWTQSRFRALAFIVRVMCEDTHDDLAAAWRSVSAAPEPARGRALAVLQDLGDVDYDRAGGPISRDLESADPVDQVRLGKELADGFRRRYALARAIAEGRDRP
jgi:ABC-type Fe3+ transport system substrate-binding protein